MNFVKMHGAGNDFIVIDNMNMHISLTTQQIKRMCDRHFGIGADGLILVEPSKTYDVRMNYYNKDGSVAEMCGNGVRCLAKFAVDAEIVGGLKPFEVETRAGKIVVDVLESFKGISAVKVFMGKVNFKTANIPVLTDKQELLGEKIRYKKEELVYGCASMGNPHMAILTEDVVNCSIEEIGSYFEQSDQFPNKCNVSFAQVVDRETIIMDTWERGVGRTMACGTGACATVSILNKLGLVDYKVRACLSGGDLTIEIVEDTVFMTGPAQVVFTGDYEFETPNIGDRLLSVAAVYGAEKLGGR